MTALLKSSRGFLVVLVQMAAWQAPAVTTVFQADFQASVVESITAVSNLNAGTAIGSWTSLSPTTNNNVYGDATAAQKALCPDSNGGGGYSLIANFTNTLLLRSNATVTLLTARGRQGSPGTGKVYYVIGQDDLGNACFDLQIFANQNQPAGTNGAVYWNDGGTYTNWFGTNFSVNGDIRNIPVSATGYNPAGMSALRIDLSTNGYVVHLDKDNNGTDEWVSSLLPYDGSPATISRILLQGDTGAGDWFDKLTVQGVVGAPGSNSGVASIQTEDQRQRITDWGFDIKEATKIDDVTPGYAQTLFVTDTKTCLRLPIWGDATDPAHPSSGVVIASYYTGVLTAMTNARAANSNVLLFASKKLDGNNSFPGWVKDGNGVIASQYAMMLADFLQFMQTNGFEMDVLGVDNEMEFNEGNITPQKYKDIIDNLRSLSASRGFTLPRRLIGPDMYSPNPGWVDGVITNGWGDRLDIVGTHYYPQNRPLSNLKKLVTAADQRSAWNSEVHWENLSAPDDVIDEGEKALATLFECTDTGLSGYVWWSYTRSGVQGGLEKNITTSTVNSRPVNMTDSDGSGATLGEIITRAYRSGTNLVVWALNNTTNIYNSYQFNLDSGAIAGTVSFEQWTTNGSTTDIVANAGSTNFQLTLPARTITKFALPYLPPGPVAWYPLDGDALDASGNGNNGMLFGSPTFVPGRVGTQALQFNGSNSYAQIPRSIGATTNFTIAFWIKTTAPGGAGAQWFNGSGLVDGEVAGAANDFGVTLTGSKIAFGVGSPDTTFKSVSTVTNGQWHHVAATRNAFTGEMNIFIDGVLETAGLGPTGPRSAPPVLRLGSLLTGTADKFFMGALDDVRLYNSLLEMEDIARLAAAPMPNQPPVLAEISDRVMGAGQSLLLTNIATDPESPPQVLAFSLITAPANAAINTNSGVFTWRPLVAQADTTNAITLVVTDNGSPNLSATQSFTITVTKLNPPGIASPIMTNNQFQLLVMGDGGPDYTLEASTNLTNWAALFTTNSPVTPFNWTDPNAGSFLKRFYRVLLGP